MVSTMQMQQNRLVWLDCEMTGLDVESERIIEIAVIITDNRLNIIAEHPSIAVHQDESLLSMMDEWNTEHHTRSGLVDRVRKSHYSEESAAQELLTFLEQHVTPGTSPMCGNSIHQDRKFLEKYMPNLAAFFHYRNLDVSSIKILAERWAPYILGGFTKMNHHLALEDVRESIAELSYYQEIFFNYIPTPDQ